MAELEPLHFEAADGLALALVVSSQAPALLLDGEQTVIAASVSFCHAFGLDAAAVQGRPLLEIGEGEWNVRQLPVLAGLAPGRTPPSEDWRVLGSSVVARSMGSDA